MEQRQLVLIWRALRRLCIWRNRPVPQAAQFSKRIPPLQSVRRQALVNPRKLWVVGFLGLRGVPSQGRPRRAHRLPCQPTFVYCVEVEQFMIEDISTCHGY